jgi:hypothetical protein
MSQEIRERKREREMTEDKNWERNTKNIVELRTDFQTWEFQTHPGNTDWRERLSTVELLIKVSCFVYKIYKIVDRKSNRSNWSMVLSPPLLLGFSDIHQFFFLVLNCCDKREAKVFQNFQFFSFFKGLFVTQEKVDRLRREPLLKWKAEYRWPPSTN